MEKCSVLQLDSVGYRRWRDRKIEAFEGADKTRLVHIKALTAPSEDEVAKLAEQCLATNLCFYRTSHTLTASDTLALKLLGQHLGLGDPLTNPQADANHISVLQDTEGSRYIPYTNAPLNWHTDGYYHPPQRAVHAFIMHCITPAGEGGSNTYFDHEMLYILLRDEDPKYVEALTHPQAMTIPADGARPAQSGAVFVADGHSHLLMRYTSRPRNVLWHKDCGPALACLREILQDNDTYTIRHTLQQGEGVICNNMVHKRDGFYDKGQAETQRTLFRARYRTRFSGHFPAQGL